LARGRHLALSQKVYRYLLRVRAALPGYIFLIVERGELMQSPSLQRGSVIQWFVSRTDVS